MTLVCVLEAQPEPTVSWFRGDAALAESNRYARQKLEQHLKQYNIKLHSRLCDRLKIKVLREANDTFRLSVEIAKLVAADGGTYKCVAKNAFGDATANLTLNFQGV